MQIQVLGTGCATCKNLFEITKKAVQDMGLETTVEYITDITKMIEMGIMTSPVLAVNGQVVMSGFSKDIVKIKELITLGINNSISKDLEAKKDDLCCGDSGKCDEDCSSRKEKPVKSDCNCGSSCC